MSNKQIIKDVFDREFNIETVKEQILVKRNEKKTNKIISLLKLTIGPMFIMCIICIIVLNNNKTFENQKIYNETELNNDIYINILKENNQSILDIDGRWVDKNIEELSIEFPFIKDLNIKNEALRTGEMYGSSEISYTEYSKLIGYSLLYIIDIDNNSRLDIFFSKTQERKPRCFSLELSNLKASIINGASVKIAKYSNNYIAVFKTNDLYFEVDAINISEKEFINLLEKIIK